MMKPRYQAVVCFFFCFLLLTGLQQRSGAVRAAFDGYPDEASHYLSGLLVHDYLVAGFPMNPHRYAINYYLHIPFFAVGYWPPLFYMVEGFWMTVVGYNRFDVLLFMALIAALISTTIFVTARRPIGVAGAFCCAVLFLLLPDVLLNSSMVMTDTAVTLLSLWSLLVLARYFEDGRWRDAILFTFLASCAMMTKYSGLYLALIPPFVLLAGKRWDLLRRPSFWLQPVLVLAFCAPWILYTHQYSTTGFASFTKPGFFASLVLNVRILAISLGPWVSLLLFGAWMYQAFFLPQAKALRLVLWVQPIALIVFQSASPVCCEPRWLISALPPLIILLALVLSRLPKWYGPGLLAATVVITAAFSIPSFHRPPDTLKPVVQAIVQNDKIGQSVVYVPSDEEGLMIAEFAMLDARRPERILARPNKLLASMDWLSNNYKPEYKKPSDIETYFDENPPDLLILHHRDPAQQYPHERMLETAVHENPKCWDLVASISGYDIYRFVHGRNAGDAALTPLYRRRLLGRYDLQ